MEITYADDVENSQEREADAAVSLVETLHATRNTTLTAVFEPTADQYWYAPNRVTVQLPVRPRIQQTLLGSYGKDRRTYLVRTRVDPRLSLEVDPTLPGRCVQVHVERYLNGAYTPVRDTSCIPLNQYSRARWRFTVNPPLGAKYRLRYEVPGDADYTAAPASWVNIRFTL